LLLSDTFIVLNAANL